MQTTEHNIYDCAIIGGGLAGLCLSIQLAKNGHSVVLIEKNKFPFHKVCGEYVSMESWSFLENLGLNLSEMNLPKINMLNVSAQNGYTISSKLEMGGFGISRYTLDNELFKLAKNLGVTVLENCKANGIKKTISNYTLNTTQGDYYSKIICGSYGKLTPSFIDKTNVAVKSNYIAVKYHIKTTLPDNVIELHNFKDGYCGISKVENETFCLCYLTTTENLQNSNNDIKLLEKNILMQNPILKKYFTESQFLFEKPLAISQINFNKKDTYKNDVFILGDAAGAIAPLCGNGMSIAMRSSKFLSIHISNYLSGLITKQELADLYTKEWNSNFGFRIKSGYYLQKLFGKKITTSWSLKSLKLFPKIFLRIIRLTHGSSF